MPANLNALIRYKTINSCLYGGKRRWSIDELRERCSEALAENRGKYTDVSERTTRDDIRVMRSDILGFNAPIKQQGGLYFYSDPGYSILSLRITDAGLAEQILGLLLKMRGKVNHPEMEIILEKLCRILDKEYEPVYVKRGKVDVSETVIHANIIQSLDEEICYNIKESPIKSRSLSSRASQFRRRMYELMWGDVLGAI